MSKNKIARLKGVVQHYAWGGTSFIPKLLGIENEQEQVYAELWMGSHPRGEATLTAKHQIYTLSNYIATEPAAILGEAVVKRFGPKLPFLFKVLDVQKMLSIQAHPTKAAAEIGFKKENEAGIPLTARHRNYKDDNHKPEVMVALSDFWLLHGFKNQDQIEQVLNSVFEFSSLQQHFVDKNIRHLYQVIMEMPQADVDQLLSPLKQRLLPAFQANQLDKSSADYWAAQAFVTYPNYCDRGIFSIYFFNLVELKKGEAIFQDAGIPHAYLEGSNMELMANSDNVFRGGLTPKHIDVAELLTHLVFDPITPQIIHGETLSDTEKSFPTPSPDFSLTKIELSENQTHQSDGLATISIVILMVGLASIESDQLFFIMKKGDVFLIPSNTPFTIIGLNEKTEIFRASVPM